MPQGEVMFVPPDNEVCLAKGEDRVIARHSPVNLDRVNFLLKSNHEDTETGKRYPAITFMGINHKWVFQDDALRDATFISLSQR